MTTFLELGFMLCFYYPPIELHLEQRESPLHLIHKLTGNREKAKSIGVRWVCICCILTSARKSGEEASPENFNAWNYREDGWSILFLLFFFFPLLKQAEMMSYYLDLALCQAVISELQTAWGLSSGESKSCAYTLTCLPPNKWMLVLLLEFLTLRGRHLKWIAPQFQWSQ